MVHRGGNQRECYNSERVGGTLSAIVTICSSRQRTVKGLLHECVFTRGVALVSNAIKKDHQNYLAAGGLGFLLGDGDLEYGRENIFETYYTVHLWRGIYVAPGLQHIANPGYNRDRGPVTVPSFRAHVEF